MPQSWYQNTAQLLVKTMLSFDLLKTPLIAALGAYNAHNAVRCVTNLLCFQPVRKDLESSMYNNPVYRTAEKVVFC